MSENGELVERVADALKRKMVEVGSRFGSSREAIEILACAAIAEVQRWRPIEEAPTDGTTILLWWRYSRHGVVGRWNGDQDGEFGWAGDEDDCIPRNQQDCLYWQPLPERPQIEWSEREYDPNVAPCDDAEFGMKP